MCWKSKRDSKKKGKYKNMHEKEINEKKIKIVEVSIPF